MAVFRSMGGLPSKKLISEVFTSTGDVTSVPAELHYIICTHSGVGSGASIECFDNGVDGTKRLHLESSSGDRSPFGISSDRPILFRNKLTLAFTATGANVSLGYIRYL